MRPDRAGAVRGYCMAVDEGEDEMIDPSTDSISALDNWDLSSEKGGYFTINDDPDKGLFATLKKILKREERRVRKAQCLVVKEMAKHGTMWPTGSPVPDGPFKGKIMP